MQRTQIYLDDEQHRALAALAADRRTTASAVIRDAIDRYLAAQLSPRDRLAQLRSLGARLAADATPDSAGSIDAVENLRAADVSRLDSLA